MQTWYKNIFHEFIFLEGILEEKGEMIVYIKFYFIWICENVFTAQI